VEWPLLLEDDGELFLERHAAEQGVERLAAGHDVFVVVLAAVGDGDQVLNTGLFARQRLVAEEAFAALREQQSVQWLGAHGARLRGVVWPSL
jgi:hypothetical protein